MSTRWPALPAEQLDDHIRELERASYEHFGLSHDEEMMPIHTPLGEVMMRAVHTGDESSQEPPVFFLHGIGSFSVMAVEVMSYVADRRIIVLDWPGHGLSGPCVIPRPSALRGLAVSLFEGVLDDLGIPTVDVVAHSLGGQFSLYAALHNPRRLRRIALLGCPGLAFPGVKPIPPMLAMALPGVGARLMSTLITAERFERFNEIAIGAGAGVHLPDEVHEAAFYMATRPDYGPSVSTFFRAIIQGTRIRAEHCLTLDEIDRILHPVLFAWGDRDVFLSPMKAAPSIVAMRHHRMLRLPGAGHAPWMQEPELIGHAVFEHLSAA